MEAWTDEVKNQTVIVVAILDLRQNPNNITSFILNRKYNWNKKDDKPINKFTKKKNKMTTTITYNLAPSTYNLTPIKNGVFSWTTKETSTK